LVLGSEALQLVAGLTISVAITLLSYRFKAVNSSGAWGMVIIGTIVFGLGGLLFAAPLLFFFVSSSLFSRIRTAGKDKTLRTVHKSGPRDFWQVMANGGVGAVAVCVYFATGNLIWFFPYLGSLCEATSDTWSTEIGTLHPDSPISLVTLKRVEPGQSGGITIIGTLAAVAGSPMTVLAGYTTGISLGQAALLDMRYWLVAANCGLAGSLFDSFLGASLQAQYQCPVCRRMAEDRIHCGQEAVHIRGWRFVGNDLVNFGSTLFGALITAVIIIFGI